MMGYEETGFALGMGDRMRAERAAAQAECERLSSLAQHNFDAWVQSQAVVADQAAYIQRLEDIIRRQAAGRA